MIKSEKLTFDSLDVLRKELEAKNESDMSCITVCGGTGCNAYECQNVVDAFKNQIEKQSLQNQVELKLSGCLGFCERGPIVLVAPDNIFYQSVKPGDAEEVVDGIVNKGEAVERLLYKTNGSVFKTIEDIPFYAKQERLLLGKNVEISPWDINDYIAIGGYAALSKVIAGMTPEEVIEEIKLSGLRGRGGGGFPTGKKWESVKNAHGDEKFVICNADEGDPGAYMDRSILEANPHCVVEGMLIGAYALGAENGYIYVRNEYPLAVKNILCAIQDAQEYGLLGENILGKGFNFTLNINRGGGAFVCGESTALMLSIEGKVGKPKTKYIHTSEKGLWGKPSCLNNVETWANVPLIINKGSSWYQTIGSENSKGTKIFSLVGKVENTGLVEVPMGITLRELVYDVGGGIRGGGKLKAVQSGGPSGGCIPERLMDTPVDFDSLWELGSIMGSGGLIVMDEETCMVDLARYFLDFLQNESCGKCVPCREGVKRLHQIVELICHGKATPEDLVFLEELAEVVKDTSLCGLGQTAPFPLLSTLKYFKDEYDAHVHEKRCPAGVCKELIEYFILEDKCNGCTACARNCPQKCIAGDKKQLHIIDREKCDRCGICRDSCKFDAVIVR